MTRESVFAEQRLLQTRLIREIVGRLRLDGRIAAVWLGGSLGRGGGDALSDIDVVLITALGRTGEVVASLSELIGSAGSPALIHEAPWNAPEGGAQLNVLYDTHPLPIYVDWDVWPPVAQRPSDARVLYGQEPGEGGAIASVSSIRSAMARGAVRERPRSALKRFRIYMAPIVVKHAARGGFDSVDRMLRAMEIQSAHVSDVGTTIELVHRILDDFADSEDETAVATIRRYLAVVEPMVREPRAGATLDPSR